MLQTPYQARSRNPGALSPANIDASTRIGKLTYYPCVKNWTGEGGEEGRRRQRLPGCFPGTFYTACAVKLWHAMMAERLFVTHDAYLKYAQLSKHPFGWFDALLLDESQDLTECQVELLVVNQPQADIFVVGDAVQSLYSWRGAAPKQLRQLRQRVAPRAVKDDLSMTRSFRFGPGIARIANHFLFLKKHSRQHSLWHHYTISGAGKLPVLYVGGEPLSGRRTVVGRSNAGLLCEAFALLSADPTVKVALLGPKDTTYERFEGICDDVLVLQPHFKAEDGFSFKCWRTS